MAHSIPLKEDLCRKKFKSNKFNLKCTLYQRGGMLEVIGKFNNLKGHEILDFLREKGVDINPPQWKIKKREEERIVFLKK